MIRKVFLFLLGLLMLAVIFNWSLIVYGVRQGMGQLEIVWKARPVSEVLEDPAFPDSLRRKLLMIEEVRQFAIDSLGLKDTENYKTLYDQKGEELMWVVTACEPFQLKARMWSFPVVGSVPYKGHFSKEKALAEANALKAEGWDVSIRNPGGWSTLGWFKDPILSGMLKRSEGDLASLIIHEMVHATLWIPDSVDFNENLASFIADTAAYDFLSWKYGPKSPPYLQYLYEDQDYRKFSDFILRSTRHLEDFYNELDSTASFDIKKTKKDSIIHSIVMNMDTLKLHLDSLPSHRFEKRLPNNTFFMAYRHYQSRQNFFQLELDHSFNGNIRSYIQYLSEKYPVH